MAICFFLCNTTRNGMYNLKKNTSYCMEKNFQNFSGS